MTPGTTRAFADEPGLDVPPNPDGQAQLLAALQSITRTDFESVLKRLGSAAVPNDQEPASTAASQTAASLDPRRFLLDVMNNPGVDQVRSDG